MTNGDTSKIVEADIVEGSRLIVYFSDSTMAIYCAADLLALRPEREKVPVAEPGE